jgi:magnesium transporter
MEVLTTVDAERISALRGRDEFFWLDLARPEPDVLEAAGKLLRLHPLALEDSREFEQRPKLDVYPDAVLFVYWSGRVTGEGETVEPVEVHLHISGGWLLTVRHAQCLVLDALHRELPGSQESEEYVVYRVLDGLTDALYPVVDQLEGRIDAIEAEVLHDPRQPQLSHIHRLKQEVQQLHRRLLAQRDQFAQSSAAILSLPGLTLSKREYFRDVGDHLVQVTGELQRQIDDLNTLTSTFFNANATRLNRQATRLTVIATFFLVWTLVTSFFGQNFGWLTRHIDSLEAFVVYESITLVIPTILLGIYFWRRREQWW